MIKNLQYLGVPIASFLLSFYWMATAIIGRLSHANHLPLAIQLAGGASIVALILLISDRRVPALSLRLFSSAITVGGLAYFLSPLFCLVALRVLPSGSGALAFSCIPLMLAFSSGFNADKLLHIAVYLSGVGLYFFGVRPEAELRADTYLPIFLVLAYPLTFSLGAFVSRRLFWTHSPVDLNFWAMLFASCVHLGMAAATGEVSLAAEWPPIYWAYLAYLTIIPSGMGYFLYQLASNHTGTLGSMLYTILTPACALGIGYAMWGESPINIFVGIGLGICGIVLLLNSYSIRPSRWMCHYLHNDSRKGDRLVCHMDAVLHTEGQASVSGTRVQVVDISIGGLGFRSEVGFAKGEKVRVEVPIGNTGGFVMFDGAVVHMSNRESKDFPWVGGLDFLKLNAEKSQYIVEFLAKLAKATER